MEIRRSEFVGPKIKVCLHDEGFAYIPKRRDFTEGPKKGNLGEIKGCRLGDLHKATMVLVHSKRQGFFLLWFIFHLRAV